MRAILLALIYLLCGARTALGLPIGHYVQADDPQVRLAISASECEATPQETALLSRGFDISAVERAGNLRVLAVLYPCATLQRLRLYGETQPYRGHSYWAHLTQQSGINREQFIGQVARQYAVPNDPMAFPDFSALTPNRLIFFSYDAYGIYGAEVQEVGGATICNLTGITSIRGRAYARYLYLPCANTHAKDTLSAVGAGLIRADIEASVRGQGTPASDVQPRHGRTLAEAFYQGAAPWLVLGVLGGILSLVALFVSRRRKPEP